MDTETIICLLGFALSLVLDVSLITFIIAKFKHKHKVSSVCECILWWMAIPIVLPFRIMKLGLVSRRLYGWLLALVSPVTLLLFFILYLGVTMRLPLSYDKLPYTSLNEVKAITDMPDFPEFEYQSNTHDGWDGTTCIKYVFKNDREVERFLHHLDQVCSEKNSIYWTKDSIHNIPDVKFYGGSEVYVCNRGWDGRYVESPSIEFKSDQVCIIIGKKGFTLSQSEVLTFSVGEYADSLAKITGVQFPSYRFVNCIAHDMFVDYAGDATIEMNDRPTKALIDSIRHTPGWKQTSDGRLHFEKDDGLGVLELYVNPNSRYMQLSYGSY